MRAPVQALIAESLNLSQGTVSRALRNRPGIRAEVRLRVLKAANRFGYALPGMERLEGSVTVKEHFAGVLLHAPHEKWRGRDSFLVGMTAVAPSMNVTLVMHHVQTRDCESILKPECQPPVMRNGGMKAVVLVFRWPWDVVKGLCSRFACVSLQHDYPGLAVDIVRANHGRAMGELVGHLRELGHEQIGFAGRCGELSWSRARYAGYVDALYQMKLPYDPRRVIDVGVEDLEAYDPPPRAGNAWAGVVENVMRGIEKGVREWMFASDWAAYNVCRGLMDRGVKVPGDVSITGFDGLKEPLFGCPLVTAALVPQQTMGTAALKLAMGRVNEPMREPSQQVFDCLLRVGGTTGRRK